MFPLPPGPVGPEDTPPAPPPPDPPLPASLNGCTGDLLAAFPPPADVIDEKTEFAPDVNFAVGLQAVPPAPTVIG